MGRRPAEGHARHTSLAGRCPPTSGTPRTNDLISEGESEFREAVLETTIAEHSRLLAGLRPERDTKDNLVLRWGGQDPSTVARPQHGVPADTTAIDQALDACRRVSEWAAQRFSG